MNEKNEEVGLFQLIRTKGHLQKNPLSFIKVNENSGKSTIEVFTIILLISDPLSDPQCICQRPPVLCTYD